MKKSLFVVLSVLALNVSIAQTPELLALNAEHPKNMGKIHGETEYSIDNAKNSDYLKLANVQSSSVIIRQMQREAANYNIKNATVYDKTEKATYLVVLKTNGNKLIIRYDQKGNILSTSEHYKNIALPTELKVAIAKEHPGWSFGQNSVQLSYDRSKGLKKNIKLQLRQGKLKKTLKINS